MSGTASPTILITTLAEYQTQFWLPVARELIAAGRDVLLLAFDDRSEEMLRAASIPCVNMYRAGKEKFDAGDAMSAFHARVRDYGIDNPNLLLSHERVTFALRDTAQLVRRFLIYANAMEEVLDRLEAEGRRAVLLQELGGFLSVIASYYAARRRGIDNLFIEPSFFRGRMFFVRNSFAALQAMGQPAREISEPLSRYLANTIKSQAIVVPIKDRHQYRTAFAKVLSLKNLRRLVAKLYDQYVLGKHQEFGHNVQYALAHARMARNAISMRRHYRELPQAGSFVYFPLHVPADMALTLRSPEFLDQVALVDYLARIMPMSHTLVIKEHPAQIGAIPAAALKRLLARHDNLVVLPPKTNNYTVLSKADAIVSINSKSGAEALLLGKHVVVLGDAFYSSCPLVHRVERLPLLASQLREALAAEKIDQEVVAPYFQAAWDQSLPGELYTTEQIPTTTRSILAAIDEPPFAARIAHATAL